MLFSVDALNLSLHDVAVTFQRRTPAGKIQVFSFGNLSQSPEFAARMSEQRLDLVRLIMGLKVFTERYYRI